MVTVSRTNEGCMVMSEPRKVSLDIGAKVADMSSLVDDWTVENPQRDKNWVLQNLLSALSRLSSREYSSLVVENKPEGTVVTVGLLNKNLVVTVVTDEKATVSEVGMSTKELSTVNIQYASVNELLERVIAKVVGTVKASNHPANG